MKNQSIAKRAHDEGLAEFSWTLTKPQPAESSNPIVVLRAWHSAFKLGLRIRDLKINGLTISRKKIVLLNFWIEAWGAHRCSTLPHFEALDFIEKVLHGQASEVRVGSAGAGRLGSVAENGRNARDAEPVSEWKVQPVHKRRRGRPRNHLTGQAAAAEMREFDRVLQLGLAGEQSKGGA